MLGKDASGVAQSAGRDQIHPGAQETAQPLPAPQKTYCTKPLRGTGTFGPEELSNLWSLLGQSVLLKLDAPALMQDESFGEDNPLQLSIIAHSRRESYFDMTRCPPKERSPAAGNAHMTSVQVQ